MLIFSVELNKEGAGVFQSKWMMKDIVKHAINVRKEAFIKHVRNWYQELLQG